MNMSTFRSTGSLLTQAVLAGLLAVLAMASDAKATVIGFNLNITATTADVGFGTGVAISDEFTGMMFFDTADPSFLADAKWARSVFPGDMLTLAGVDFDANLNQAWVLFFIGGSPTCFALISGCGDATQQGFVVGGTDLLFRSDGTGSAADGGAVYDQFAFTYGFTAKRVPEPPALFLWATGLALLLLMGRWRRKGVVPDRAS